MNLVAVREGVGIAIEALRSNKVRAALTVLGIVIGVATVMAMAAMIGGIRASLTEQLESLGPENFVVMRFDQTKVRMVNDGTQRPPWEGKPPLTLEEAALIGTLPSVRAVNFSVNTNADLKYGAQTVSGVMIQGNGADWTEYDQGDFIAGHNFLPVDVARSASVAVLSDDLAKSVFGGTNPIGKRIRLAGEEFEVVGTYKQKENLFSGAMKNWAVVPNSAALKRLTVDRDWAQLLVVTAPGSTQEQAMDDVTAALRGARGLGPAEENNFALVRQEAFREMFDRLTGVFFLVMLVLSSIGLMVGGVGVVAIMMISVSERTREIGVRKALGATRREILWQFLVESMTVTSIGGMIGMALGAGGALLLAAVTPIPAAVPLWSVAAALGVSAVAGIGFGLYPANRAARLDPVDALRYE
ncbi:MAG TPA: ABC transporter permease [Longimicrobiaceae bacterium]|jgi:putative ABC transport system permease protein|nr:ABC transporter permease [Longimicrobiaceae bacterium]